MSNERIEQLLTDANAAIDAGDIGRAVAGYQEVLASEPDNYEACLMLGSLLGEAGQLEQAAALLRSAAAVRTDDATASITLGHVLRAMGDGAGAIAALEEAVRREPRDYDAICTLGSMFAESEYRAGQWHSSGRLPRSIRNAPRPGLPWAQCSSCKMTPRRRWTR